MAGLQEQEDLDYNNVIIISVSPSPSIIDGLGGNPADPPPPGVGESEEEIREIQARAREPRLNSRPGSPALVESDSSSIESGSDISESMQCGICASGREMTVQFKGCTHASCKKCLKNLWWGRVQHDTHYPTWFSCPWCRAEITEVGMLVRSPSGLGSAEMVVATGNVSLMVHRWEKLVSWMRMRSRRLHLR